MSTNTTFEVHPTRSVFDASRTALGALILRDLVVLWKTKREFVLRTLIQPFLLCFVFLFVFPKIGQAVGGSSALGAAGFATVLVPGVVGISVMFQGVQSIALTMSQEFGFTREIEDRVQAPCPIWLVAMSKVLSGSVQGLIAALIVFPIASVVHASGVEADISLHWLIILTFLPITFLGGTYYPWTHLAPVKIGGFHWLQTLVLINPLVYVNEGMRAAFTNAPHMHLYVVYPVMIAFGAFFLTVGLRNFRRRVLS